MEFIFIHIFITNTPPSNTPPQSRFLPINISSALHLSLQMLDCVQSVHEKGYLHRDVKPSNFVRTGMNEDEREFKIIGEKGGTRT